MLGISLKRVLQRECSCSWLLSKSRKLVFIISDMPLSCLCHVLKKTQDRPTDFLTPLPCRGKLLVVSMPFSEGFSKFERQSMDQKNGQHPESYTFGKDADNNSRKPWTAHIYTKLSRMKLLLPNKGGVLKLKI